MTFLEFVIRRFAGPPKHGYFPCPLGCHSDPYKVKINAPKLSPLTGKPLSIRARCQAGCGPGPGGCFSEYDVMRVHFPHSRYPQHEVILADLREEWEQDEAARQEAADQEPDEQDADASNPSSPRENLRGMHGPQGAVAWAWADLLEVVHRCGLDCRAGYEYLRELYESGYLREQGWFFSWVLEYWAVALQWFEETDRRHMVGTKDTPGCRDPECEWLCCRATHRGFIPLTREELAEERKAAEADRRAAQAEDEEFYQDIKQQILGSINNIKRPRRF